MAVHSGAAHGVFDGFFHLLHQLDQQEDGNLFLARP
jgi:hypothetical protein